MMPVLRLTRIQGKPLAWSCPEWRPDLSPWLAAFEACSSSPGINTSAGENLKPTKQSWKPLVAGGWCPAHRRGKSSWGTS